MLPPFRLHAPTSVAEASALLRGHGPAATVYAGGTELVPVMKEGLTEFAHLVDIKGIAGLDAIRLDPGDPGLLRIGALARHRAIERSPLVRARAPLLADLAARVANVRVRHQGTLGGNLCFAEPHSDPATLLVAWGARFVLATGDGERVVPAADFFHGLFATDRAPHEIMTEILLPLPAAGPGLAYERFKAHERPSAAVAAVVAMADGAITDVALVVGAVGDRPERMPAAETALLGQAPSPELFAAAAESVRDAVAPTEDPFESTDYKRHLAAVLTRRALAVAAEGVRRAA